MGFVRSVEGDVGRIEHEAAHVARLPAIHPHDIKMATHWSHIHVHNPNRMARSVDEFLAQRRLGLGRGHGLTPVHHLRAVINHSGFVKIPRIHAPRPGL